MFWWFVDTLKHGGQTSETQGPKQDCRLKEVKERYMYSVCRVCICVCVYMYMCMPTCVYVVCVNVCRVCVYLYMCIYMCACLQVCMCGYSFSHT